MEYWIPVAIIFWGVVCLDILLLIVFLKTHVNYNTLCDGCGAEILKGDECYPEGEKTLCLSCHLATEANPAREAMA